MTEEEKLQQRLAWCDQMADSIRQLLRTTITNLGHVNVNISQGTFEAPPGTYVYLGEIVPDGTATVTLTIFDPTRRGT